MEILIDDIPESGLTIKADPTKDVWFKRVIQDALGDSFAEGDNAALELTLIRTDEEVGITGELILATHPTCDRCLKAYNYERAIPLQSHMTPLYENKRQRQREHDEGMENEVVKEDLGFSYYEGDRIYLDEIIAEQLLLAEPMKHLCSEDCKGLCQRCGKNLNEGSCDCAEKHEDPRWDALKNMKFN